MCRGLWPPSSGARRGRVGASSEAEREDEPGRSLGPSSGVLIYPDANLNKSSLWVIKNLSLPSRGQSETIHSVWFPVHMVW